MLAPVLVILLVLTGCANIRKVTSPDDENLLSGAGSIMKSSTDEHGDISTEGFEEIDLQALLKSYGLHEPNEITESQLGTEQYKYLRNDLQERLINASNQRCSAYIRTVVSSQSQTQMGWTGLAALLAGAATVVPHELTARTLAAGSTFSIGILNSYNESYFNNLAITVVSSGISRKRENILSSIEEKQEKPLTTYPVNAAIADALTYHGACNIVSGMEEASNALNSENGN